MKLYKDKTLLSYFIKLVSLTIESLSDPRRCHLNFAEQQVTEEIGQEELILDLDIVVGCEIEPEYTETDVIGNCECGY